MPDPITRAAYCLRQSEQCLRLADAADNADLKDQYQRMSREYLELANAEQQVAAKLANVIQVNNPASASDTEHQSTESLTDHLRREKG